MAVIGLALWPFVVMNERHVWTALRSWASATVWGLRWIIGARVSFEGLENVPKGGALIAMKHQSTYDTVAPFLFIQNPGYILKKELLKLPVFGIYASRVGIPIDRAGGTKTMKKMLVDAKKGIEGGQQIIIFPEGTRQLPDTPTDIKPGVIFMYNELEVPCVPVALNTGLCWQGSGFTRRPGRIIFEVLKPIEPGLKRAELTQRAGPAQHQPRDDRRRHHGQGHPPEDGE